MMTNTCAHGDCWTVKWTGGWTLTRSKRLALSFGMDLFYNLQFYVFFSVFHKNVINWKCVRELFFCFSELSFNNYAPTCLFAFFLCMRLTVSLPAVAPDGEGGDSISGDPGGGGCDLHLDTPSTLLIVALQCCAVQRRLDGITHLRENRSTHLQSLLLQRMQEFHSAAGLQQDVSIQPAWTLQQLLLTLSCVELIW